MDRTTEVVAVELPNGAELGVQVGVSEGTGDLDHLDFGQVQGIIDGLTQAVAESLRRVPPQPATVELGLRLEVRAGRLTCVLAQAGEDASIRIAVGGGPAVQPAATGQSAPAGGEVRQAKGVFERISVLERNLEAAVDRLTEYYNSQCRKPDFYRDAPLLKVALSDLDKAAADVSELANIVGMPIGVPGYAPSAALRLELKGLGRDLREAVGRRDQAYEWFRSRLDRQGYEEAWEVFAVMTSDILKADRMLEALLSQYITARPEEYMRSIAGYVDAALRRAWEFEEGIQDSEVSKPKIFDIMIEDLSTALRALKALQGGDLSDISSQPATTGSNREAAPGERPARPAPEKG
jgi:hypothetical protein